MKYNNKILSFLSFILLMGFSISANAQGKMLRKANGVVGGIYSFNLGYAMHDYGNLNSVLVSNGAIELPKGSLTTGFDFSLFMNNVVLGGSYNYSTSKNEENNSSIKLKNREGYFRLGYVVFATKKTFIYPTIGIGTSTIKLSYTDSTSSNNFNDFVKLNGRATNLDAQPLTLNAELNIVHGAKAGIYGLVLGYTTSAQSVIWRSNGLKIGGNPDWRYSNMYAKLTIGLGKIMNLKRPKRRNMPEVEDEIMDIGDDDATEAVDGVNEADSAAETDSIDQAASDAVEEAVNETVDDAVKIIKPEAKTIKK